MTYTCVIIDHCTSNMWVWNNKLQQGHINPALKHTMCNSYIIIWWYGIFSFKNLDSFVLDAKAVSTQHLRKEKLCLVTFILGMLRPSQISKFQWYHKQEEKITHTQMHTYMYMYLRPTTLGVYTLQNTWHRLYWTGTVHLMETVQPYCAIRLSQCQWVRAFYQHKH